MEMETKPYSLQSPEQIAKDYGGNKQKIAQAAQSGLLDPTAAVMAGMFIDRMRDAQMDEQGPPQTVAQDILAPQQMQQPQQMPQGMPQQMGGQMPQGMPQQMPQGAGLDALPVPDQMFGGPGMASGGLVAFSKAGEVNRQTELDEQTQKDRQRMGLPIDGVTLESIANVATKAGSAGLDVGTIPYRLAGSGVQTQLRLLRALGLPVPAIPEALTLDGGLTPFTDSFVREPEKEAQARGEEETQLTDLGATDQQASPLEDEEVSSKKPAPTATGSAKATGSATAPVAPTEEKESALDSYARMLMGSLEDRESSKEDARNMALLQAGLGIMGGQSQNAFENIARGALPATQAYQQQMAAGRKEERETIGALADLDLKAKELGLTEKRYADLLRIAEMQLAASAGKKGGITQKDIGNAILKQTDAILKSSLGIDPKEAEKAATDMVYRVYGLLQGGDTNDIAADYDPIKGDFDIGAK